MIWTLPIGAQPDQAGVRFRVWAANASRVAVVIYAGDSVAGEFELAPAGDGYFAGHVAGIGPGARYRYRLDGGDPRADPAARSQPDGVHGPSQVVDPAAFAWSDGVWRGVPLADAIIYELHVGTATDEGTFDALIARLDDIRALGVTAIELMPIADFPGDRNWGYDGVNLFAPARAYGGPEALRRLVDAAHARGLAVLLDVVYNHLGPDGNFLRQFSAAYFTDHHKTPWGDALNLDAPGSGPVRAFFLDNARYWLHEYHLDGLRLDATHELRDDSPTHLLAELSEAMRATLPANRHFLLIAENENNDPTLVRTKNRERAPAGSTENREPRTKNQEPTIQHPDPNFNSQFTPGYGLDAVWADDFHHQMRVALTGEREGYYADYAGTAADLATTLRQGWFYSGQSSTALGHPRGAPADDVTPEHFVYCIQNHDQIGNRALGERLSQDIALDTYRAASALLLLSPYTPLLFMGQEWAASTPFLYFTDHNPELGKLITQGRQAEFAGFTAFSGASVPDPQARATFLSSKLRWAERTQPPHAGVLQLYRDLLAMRQQLPTLRAHDRDAFAVVPVGAATLIIRRTGPLLEDTLLLIVHLRGALRLRLSEHPLASAPDGMRWAALFDSEDARYAGRGVARLDADVLDLEGPGALVLGVKGER